jgi:exonuclease SbcC
MILNKVTLENFISHKQSEIDLGYGINVVVGPNGAGKTTILDAISFALFNDYSNRGKKEKLINDKAKKCKVCVSFVEAGIGYDAEWSIERKGSAHGSLFRIVDGQRKLLIKDGERSVIPEIQKVLGFDKNMFMQSVYVRQGEIEKLVTSTPGDRKELISRLLGVEELETAWECMKSVIQEYREKQIVLKTEIDRKPTVEKTKKEYETKAAELEALISSKKTTLADIESELKRLQTILDDLKSKKKQFENCDKEKGLIEGNIQNLKQKHQREEEELGQAVAAQEFVSKLENVIAQLPFLEGYVEHLAEKEKQELLFSSFSTKLEEVKQLKKTLETTSKDHETYLENDKLIGDKRKERRNCEGAETSLAKAKKRLKELDEEKLSKQTNFEKELEKASKALDEPVTVDSIELTLERKKQEYQKAVQEFDSRVSEISGTISVLTQRLKDLEENLSKFASADDIKNCPTCETELTAERLNQLVSKYSLEKAESENKKSKLQNDLIEARASLDQARKKLKKIDAVDSERVKMLATELEGAKSRITLQENEIKEIERQAEGLRQIDSSIDQLENEKRSLEEAYKEFESARRRIEKLPSEEEIEKQITPITEAIQSVSGLIQTSLEKLGYEPKEPQKELKELRKKKETYDQKLPIALKKTECDTLLQKTNKEISIAEGKHADLILAMEKIGYSEKEHEEQQGSYDSKKNALGSLEKEIVRIKQSKTSAEEESGKCAEELKALEKRAAEKKRVENFIAKLNQIRDAYGKDGIQKIIRAKARPLLERSTRDLFERFNLAYSDIKIDDDYNIAVIGTSGEKDIDQISGGERVALAIALRLAIAQVLSGKIETIIMDEPTTHLDEQRRRELVNILSSFFREGGRIIPQMLIITHHTEIEDVADTVYTVRKEEEYSVAEKQLLT